MTTSNRRRAAIIGVSGVSLAVAGAIAPGAFAANTVDGDVTVSNTETVQVLMDASGSVDAQRIYEQLVLRGKGKVDIANPVETKGLRNLDGFGGFDVREGQARIDTSVDGVKKYRSVSDYTKPLPVDIKVTYKLDGKKVEPGDVVGKAGDLEVRYEVKNITGKQQDVTYKDGNGDEQTAVNAVVIPMVGSLTTVLPSNFTRVQSAEANAAGDGRGGTQLSFTMTLFPPIGSDRATFGYKARITDGEIPKASISMLPVNPLESPSFKGGAASYAGGAESGVDLTAGATTIDTNLLKIRDGANDLVDGILQLKDGADQLSDGLTNDAAPGAAKLAAGARTLDDGTGQLSDGTGKLKDGAGKLDAGAGDLRDGTGKLKDGAGKLNKGAGDLADGSGRLSAGAGEVDKGAGDLADGSGRLSAGAGEVDKGAAALSDGLKEAGSGAPALLKGLQDVEDGIGKVDAGLQTLGAGGTAISAGAQALIDAVSGQLVPGLDGVTGALNDALDVAKDVTDPTQKAKLTAYLNGAKDGVATIKGGLTGKVVPGLGEIKTGGQKITGGVGSPESADTLRNGTAKLKGGVDQLQAGGAKLAGGLGQLSAGADKLKAGTGDLSKGASDLNAGAGKLKAGTGRVSKGASDLNAGAGKLKAGTGDLSKGAGDLNAGAGKLKAGTGDLSKGAGDLNAGAGKLKGGTGQLSDGASKLADGLGTAAAGSGKLAAGLGTAAESAPALPEGAQQLSDQGTSQLVNVGNATAMDYGLKYALIEAGAKRAATAQPYGSPEGATALTAYKFELAGADGASSANMKRGIAAVVLLAGAGALAAFRRRGII